MIDASLTRKFFKPPENLVSTTQNVFVAILFLVSCPSALVSSVKTSTSSMSHMMDNVEKPFSNLVTKSLMLATPETEYEQMSANIGNICFEKNRPITVYS